MNALTPLFAALTLSAGTVPGPVAPATEMTTLRAGFSLVTRAPVPIPSNGRQSVFVLQSGQLHPGMWAWRGERFIVLSNLGDPSSDVALDSARPSCQVHVDTAATSLPEEIPFKPMAFVGELKRSGMYNALSSPDEAVYLNCLTGRATGPELPRFLAGDVLEAWGAALLEIRGK